MTNGTDETTSWNNIVPDGSEWHERGGIYDYLMRGNVNPDGPPYNGYFHVQHLMYGSSTNCTQIAWPYSAPNNGGFIRTRYSNSWTDWQQFLTVENANGRYLQLSGGVMTGNIDMGSHQIYNAGDISTTGTVWLDAGQTVGMRHNNGAIEFIV